MQNVKRFTTAQKAILTTLLYSDIFSFPLTKDELWKFLISEKKISREEFEKALLSLKKLIVYHQNFYCLSGREEIIVKRQQNLFEVDKKMQRARFVAEKLSHIPSILFIGISGGLAVGNVTKNDDIDFVIIVKKNTLFVSRLLVLFILQSLGVRRFRNQKNTADTVCVNLLFDETVFSWFKNNQDVYLAREIAQIVPLFERNNMYYQFLLSNRWIKKFLPNVSKSSLLKQGSGIPHSHKGTSFYEGSVAVRDDSKIKFLKMVFINPFFEMLSKMLQVGWMKRHRTSEIIDKHVLAFHPFDYRAETLRQLRLKTRQFGLLTKF